NELTSRLDFVFQAEDCIRDRNVTGVQTCAPPIYRKVFYRFAFMPDDNIKPFSNNPHQSFSIIILNKDYEIIGETKFPGNTYAHHLCFVGKKGLYISENNENNPQFDENKLVFRCFTLQGRKK